MKTKIEQLRSWIAESKRMVFFGGAGVSTESGIPDFRSVDGLYHQKFDYPPETIISHSFFLKNPEYFYRFYREKMLPLGFEPNVTHRVLARLEQEGHLAAVVTQNIDGLHQKAGSRNVFELHGSVLRNHCMKCGKFYPAEFIRDAQGYLSPYLRRHREARTSCSMRRRSTRKRWPVPFPPSGRLICCSSADKPHRLPRCGPARLLPRRDCLALINCDETLL